MSQLGDMASMRNENVPGLLIATPPLTGEPFRHAVVLLAEWTEAGAMGVIVNHPLSLTLGDLADDLNLRVADVHRASRVYLGGPVRAEQGFVVLQRKEGEPLPDGLLMEFPDRVVAAASMETLQAVFLDPESRFRLYLGYAGWSAEQLDQEIQNGSWIPEDYETHAIFDEEPATLWERRLQAQGVAPWTLWSRARGDA